MRKLILVKYAPEIFLKGLNRCKFERKLRSNIEKVLKDVNHEFVMDLNRWFLYGENLDEIINRVRKVFGVSELCIVKETEATMEAIQYESLQVVKKLSPKTFKIETNRANKRFPLNSMEVSSEVGAYVLTNFQGINVDVKKPELLLQVEIRNKAYIYLEKIKATGGLPYGMNGSTMLMLSGGIDSPVAGYLMARRGVELNCVYYHSHPYTSERAKEKVKDLGRILASYTGKVKLYVVPFTEIQMDIIDKCREDELTIIMRRFMMRCACVLADKLNVNSITTGESVGQVASQTMEGLVCSDNCSDRPVFRPLIAMDKTDIMEIAKEIDTYETSILPYEDCCTIFVPKHPKTNPSLKGIIRSEEPLDIDALVNKAIDNLEFYKL